MGCSKSLEDLEITLLLEAIYQRFGDDFRGYQKDIIRDKLHAFMLAHNIGTVSSLQNCALHDSSYIGPLLCALDAHTASLFDHPNHLCELRSAAIPLLRSCPAPKVWITECTSAEDVYTIAIILMEEGVYDKTQLFATGVNPLLLTQAREAKFSLEKLPQYEENYVQAGGAESLGKYYTLVNGEAVFRTELNRNITWAQYNLGTDASFNEFELIVCRGGLTDYATKLRRRALQVFYDSLPVFGILSVANAHYADLAPLITRFSAHSSKHGLYRKIR